jgi:hypothetical protein
VASWRGKTRAERRAKCFACGRRMEPALLHAGSLRCLKCRESDRPLDAALVESQGRRLPTKSLAGAFGRRLLQPRPKRTGDRP